MRRLAALLVTLMAVPLLPAFMGAQGSGYPITLIPPGKGPFTFPAGDQMP